MKRSTNRLRATGDQVQDHLGVRGRLEDGALGDQPLAQGQEVGQVAVVGDGDAAGLQVGEHRLDVAQDAAAGGGIAGVADGRAPGSRSSRSRRKGVGDVAHVAFGVEALAVERGDAAGLLAAVLQGVQAQRRDRGGVGLPNTPNTPHSRRSRRRPDRGRGWCSWSSGASVFRFHFDAARFPAGRAGRGVEGRRAGWAGRPPVRCPRAEVS